MTDDRPALLVNPRICSRKSARLPLSLLALGAVLEGRRRYRIVDGNFDDAGRDVLSALAGEPHALVGLTVMPGPQVGPAIALSRAVRERSPEVPIAWGGYFPTLYPDAAINAPYVDYVVRGAGEETLLDLLERLPSAGPPRGLDSATDPSALAGVRGLTYRAAGAVRHEADRPFRPPDDFPPYPYERLGDVGRALAPTFLGRRTAVHQAAIGCRYRCSFCGVVSMFGGLTRLSGPARVAAALSTLKERHGADSVQFYDNNFFDAEESAVPLLEALAPLGLPYWCYARPDTLAGFSAATWGLLRRSGLRMAYLGAEAASDEALRKMHKGAKVEHTLEVARRCRENGVVPEFSFCLGGPEDPEGEIERTLAFVRVLKGIHPECEVILYFYTPTPRRERGSAAGPLPLAARYGSEEIGLPETPEEWTRPEWVNFVCHTDAPWLPQRTRQRVRDFARVLGCRFPTVQDVRTPGWGKALLSALASWRWRLGVYGRPWELELARSLVPLKEPATEGL